MPIGSDQPDRDEADDNEEEDDDDSGVGTEERRPQEGETSHGRRRRRRKQDLDDGPFKTSVSLPPSSETTSTQANGRPSADDVSENLSVARVSPAKKENGTSFFGEGDDDDGACIPSIVDRFTSYPLPEAEAFRRQKGSNVCWNPVSHDIDGCSTSLPESCINIRNVVGVSLGRALCCSQSQISGSSSACVRQHGGLLGEATFRQTSGDILERLETPLLPVERRVFVLLHERQIGTTISHSSTHGWQSGHGGKYSSRR